MLEHMTHEIRSDEPAPTGDKQSHAMVLAGHATPAQAPATRTFYACQRCTACCRRPGFVRLTEADIDRAAILLGIAPRAFIEDFTELRPDRCGLVLRNRADDACVFLEEDRCRIHDGKPDQCVGFPNTWNFPGWREMCRAIPTTVDANAS